MIERQARAAIVVAIVEALLMLCGWTPPRGPLEIIGDRLVLWWTADLGSVVGPPLLQSWH